MRQASMFWWKFYLRARDTFISGFIFQLPVWWADYFIPVRKLWHTEMAISVLAMKESFENISGHMTRFDHVTSFWTKKGFRGDGKNVCYDINECRERSHNCERRNGICTNKKGTFACSCDFGYEGDGYHCVDHDECEAGDHLCPGSSLSKTVPKRLTGSGEFWSLLHMKLGRHV